MAMRRGAAGLGAGWRLLAAGLLAGCAVGPDYAPPPAPTVARLTNGPMPTATVAADTVGGNAQRLMSGRDVPGEWWTLFHSSAIDAAVRQALAANPDLAAAQASLLEARQMARAALGALMPSAGAGFNATHQQIALAALGIPPSAATTFGLPSSGIVAYSLYTGTLNVSYTLDVFGGIRREIEAAGAQADYQQEELEAAYLSLTANLVAAMLNAAALQAEIVATNDIIGIYREELGVIESRFAAGAVSRADVLQQQSSLAAQVATLPPLQKQLEQTRDQIAVYLGGLPSQYQGPTLDLTALTLPAELPASLPSQIVAQRPDVRAYAALLHAATANVGVALANMLPQFTLTGSYGSEVSQISQLFTPGGIVWSIAGAIAQPVFEGGALLARKRAAVAGMQAAAAQYSSTLNVAFQNVADALVALARDAETLRAELDADRAASENLAVVRVQYRSGSTGYESVLQAEQTFRRARLLLVAAQAARFTDTVALFAALGGGWWHRQDVDPHIAHCCGVLP